MLPTGYAGMIVLAIVPAVWRRVMDPRVLAHFGGRPVTARTSHPASASGSWRGTPLAPAAPVAEPRVAGGRASAARPRCTGRLLAAATPAHVLRSPGPSPPARAAPTRRGAGVGGARRAGTSTTWSRGRRREGFAAGTAWSEVPDGVVLPRLRRAGQGRLRDRRRQPPPRRRMHERVVAAAAALTLEVGWAGVTMGKLADRVGVSRQTVYNEVGSKPQLAEEMVLAELAKFLAVVDEAFDRAPGGPGRGHPGAPRAASSSSPGPTPCCRRSSPASYGAETELLPLLTTPQRRAGADRDRGRARAGCAAYPLDLDDRPPRRGHRHGRAAGAVARRPPGRVRPADTADDIAWISEQTLRP